MQSCCVTVSHQRLPAPHTCSCSLSSHRGVPGSMSTVTLDGCIAHAYAWKAMHGTHVYGSPIYIYATPQLHVRNTSSCPQARECSFHELWTVLLLNGAAKVRHVPHAGMPCMCHASRLGRLQRWASMHPGNQHHQQMCAGVCYDLSCMLLSLVLHPCLGSSKGC